jgi:hypothetical protein
VVAVSLLARNSGFVFLRRNYDTITNQRKAGGHSNSKKLQVRER